MLLLTWMDDDNSNNDRSGYLQVLTTEIYKKKKKKTMLHLHCILYFSFEKINQASQSFKKL